MQSLNSIQLEILKLFQHAKTDAELLELKKVLVDFLAKKTIAEADKAFDDKGHTIDDIMNWKSEHNRKTNE